MYEIIKEKDFDKFYEEFNKKDFIKILGDLRDYLNYRCYYKIDEDGNILKKNPNILLIKLIFDGGDISKEELKEFFDKGIYFGERQKLKKIDRMSNVSIENLSKNLYKVIFNRDLTIALRYIKEYYLRDKEGLKKKLVKYVLLDRVESNKALVLLSMFRLFEYIKDDNDLDTVLHICVNYLVRYPSFLEASSIEDEDNVYEMDLYAHSYNKLISLVEDEQNYFRKKLTLYIKYNDFGKIDEKLYERLSE